MPEGIGPLLGITTQCALPCCHYGHDRSSCFPTKYEAGKHNSAVRQNPQLLETLEIPYIYLFRKYRNQKRGARCSCVSFLLLPFPIHVERCQRRRTLSVPLSISHCILRVLHFLFFNPFFFRGGTRITTWHAVVFSQLLSCSKSIQSNLFT